LNTQTQRVLSPLREVVERRGVFGTGWSGIRSHLLGSAGGGRRMVGLLDFGSWSGASSGSPSPPLCKSCHCFLCCSDEPQIGEGWPTLLTRTSLQGFPPEVHEGGEESPVRFSPRWCCRQPRCRDIGSLPPPLQRREAWAGNHFQSWVEVHCRRRTSSPDSSPSWRTGGQWQPRFGTTVPTRWRWLAPAPGPRTRTAPWHRGT
jgi:hypothetical protein